jgi:catechol 2,3-dioxygenase-like lactoylglutathione lyase family enzyme
MRVTRILHHSINVAGQLDGNVAFYRERLGLADAPRPDLPGIGGHWFGLDPDAAGGAGAQVHLVDAAAAASGIAPTGPHVCFGVDDLTAAIAELERDGVEYRRGQQGDVVQIWILDPAGHTIELQQDPAERPRA